MALQTGDYWAAVKAGVRERSIAAVGSHIRYVRDANHNARELTRRGEMPPPSNLIYPAKPADGAARAPTADRQTRQAATTGFVQKILADERKAQRGEGQKDMSLKQQEDVTKPKKQMRQ